MLKCPLAYRILTMDPVAPVGNVVKDAFLCKVEYIRHAINLGSIIQADNIAEFYAKHSQQEWDFQTDIPNISPPWSFSFIEWKEPKNWNLGAMVQKISEQDEIQTGCFIQAMDVTDKTKNNLDSWVTLLSGLMGVGPDGLRNHSADTVSAIREYIPKSRFVLFCDYWFTVSIGKSPLNGKPAWFGLSQVVFVSAYGGYLNMISTGPSIERFNENPSSCFHIPALTLSFCHCKNVVKHTEEQPRSKKFHKQHKVPVLKFTTLEINPMKEVLRTEGQSETLGLKKALHICRGHFATYTEDKPLFGRITGTFWKPQHVRGSKEAGEVIKDYTIKPNKEQSQ